MNDDIVKRVERIEDEHDEFKQLLRDFSKDFHMLTSNFTEVKDVLKTLSQSQIDFALFRKDFQSHADLEEAATKRIHARLDLVERNQSRVAWTVLTAVIVAVLGLVIKGAH